MELTQEVIDRLVGGQLEVQNQMEGYIYRGEISAMRLDGEGDSLKLTVNFSWFAMMGEDCEWDVAEVKPYAISMLIYTVSDIGEGRIFFSSFISGESTTIFPPGGSRLDPARVRGLILA